MLWTSTYILMPEIHSKILDKLTVIIETCKKYDASGIQGIVE